MNDMRAHNYLRGWNGHHKIYMICRFFLQIIVLQNVVFKKYRMHQTMDCYQNINVIFDTDRFKYISITQLIVKLSNTHNDASYLSLLYIPLYSYPKMITQIHVGNFINDLSYVYIYRAHLAKHWKSRKKSKHTRLIYIASRITAT